MFGFFLDIALNPYLLKQVTKNVTEVLKTNIALCT